MPITHTISQELEGVSFCKELISKEVKNLIGSSEGVSTRREQYKNAFQSLMSIESRLKQIEARARVDQPTLF